MKKHLVLLFIFITACSGTPKQLDQTQWTQSLIGATLRAMDADGKAGKKPILKKKGFMPLTQSEAYGYVRNQEKDFGDALEAYGIIVQRAGQDLIIIMFDENTFADEKYTINKNTYKRLDFIIKELNKNNRSYVEVLGFTDSNGTAMENYSKSVSKARSIASYLINNDLNAYRVFVDGKGENYPIADNTTSHGRNLNKRVEIRIAPIFE